MPSATCHSSASGAVGMVTLDLEEMSREAVLVYVLHFLSLSQKGNIILDINKMGN